MVADLLGIDPKSSGALPITFLPESKVRLCITRAKGEGDMIIVIAFVAMVLAGILYAVGHSEARPISSRQLGYFDDFDCWMARQSEPPPAVS